MISDQFTLCTVQSFRPFLQVQTPLGDCLSPIKLDLLSEERSAHGRLVLADLNSRSTLFSTIFCTHGLSRSAAQQLELSPHPIWHKTASTKYFKRALHSSGSKCLRQGKANKEKTDFPCWISFFLSMFYTFFSEYFIFRKYLRNQSFNFLCLTFFLVDTQSKAQVT